MKKKTRSPSPTPGYIIAALSLLLCIFGVALAYALASGRLSLRNGVAGDAPDGVVPGTPTAQIPVTAATDMGSSPVAGGSGLPGTSCIPSQAPETGTVIEVLDGDTIRVRVDQDGSIQLVNYIGVNAPESRTEIELFGTEAALKNAELVSDQAVTLVKDVSEPDGYGQLRRYVLTETAFVNYELIVQGYAEALRELTSAACIHTFETAQEQASDLRLGMWAVRGGPPCSCIGSELQCLDFDTRKQAQACFDQCQSQGFGDTFHLDYDADGIACEQLP